MARKKKPQPKSLESIRNALSVRVAELRNQRDMTQLQLAEASGLALQYLTKIEQGDRSPSLKTLVALASALDVPVYELFNFEAREITGPRVEVQLLELRRRLDGASEDDVKLLNQLADRLGAGTAPTRKSRKKRS